MLPVYVYFRVFRLAGFLLTPCFLATRHRLRELRCGVLFVLSESESSPSPARMAKFFGLLVRADLRSWMTDAGFPLDVIYLLHTPVAWCTREPGACNRDGCTGCSRTPACLLALAAEILARQQQSAPASQRGWRTALQSRANELSLDRSQLARIRLHTTDPRALGPGDVGKGDGRRSRLAPLLAPR